MLRAGAGRSDKCSRRDPRHHARHGAPRNSAKPARTGALAHPTPSPECSLRFERGNTRARLASEAKQDLLCVFDVTKRDGLEALAGLFGVQHRHFVDVVSVVDLGGERTPTSVNGADLTSS